MDRKPEVFFEGLDFGEAPRWHDGRLWVSDFYAHRVRSFGATGDEKVEVDLDDQPSGLGWLPSGELLVVAMTTRQVRRVDSSGQVHLHAAGVRITHVPYRQRSPVSHGRQGAAGRREGHINQSGPIDVEHRGLCARRPGT